jgi:hypothetical protein
MIFDDQLLMRNLNNSPMHFPSGESLNILNELFGPFPLFPIGPNHEPPAH